MISIGPSLMLPDEAVSISFVRSRGPGGQNVNKVNSCAVLAFDVRNCPFLSPPIRERLLVAIGSRLTRSGELLLRCDSHRTAEANRREIFARFSSLISRALRPPKPRHATRPTKASKVRRLKEKARRSDIKQNRRRGRLAED